MKKVLKVLMIILLVMVLIAAGGFAYLYFNGMSGMSNTSEPKEGQIRIARVGDSTTYGHGISGWPKNNYPSLLQKLLGEKYHVNNYGVSSFAVQEDADRSYRTLPHYQESLAYDADYVVFMMGSNDSKPYNWKGADAFKEDLLMATVKSFSVRCLLLSSWRVRPKALPITIFSLWLWMRSQRSPGRWQQSGAIR